MAEVKIDKTVKVTLELTGEEAIALYGVLYSGVTDQTVKTLGLVEVQECLAEFENEWLDHPVTFDCVAKGSGSTQNRYW